jgi:hypothetical protein
MQRPPSEKKSDVTRFGSKVHRQPEAPLKVRAGRVHGMRRTQHWLQLHSLTWGLTRVPSAAAQRRVAAVAVHSARHRCCLRRGRAPAVHHHNAKEKHARHQNQVWRMLHSCSCWPKSPPNVTNQHGSHRQRQRNDATELAHADMTTLPKVGTSCTALSLMPTVNGNTFAASLRTDISPQRKEARPRLTESD